MGSSNLVVMQLALVKLSGSQNPNKRPKSRKGTSDEEQGGADKDGREIKEVRKSDINLARCIHV